MGIVSHKILKDIDIVNPVYFADINWKLMMKAVKNQSVKYHEISKFPAVSRDLALLLDESVEFERLRRLLIRQRRNSCEGCYAV